LTSVSSLRRCLQNRSSPKRYINPRLFYYQNEHHTFQHNAFVYLLHVSTVCVSHNQVGSQHMEECAGVGTYPARLKRRNGVGLLPALLQHHHFPASSPLVRGRMPSLLARHRYGLSGPGIESRWGGEIFRIRPDLPRDPPSLLYNGYRVCPGGKTAGAWR
jgi:hypothetical protein